MKQKLLTAIFACCLLTQNIYGQTGYIYVHLKHINEEASPNYSYTVTNSSGTTVSTFNLNDQAAADNVALSGNYIYIYDIGESHGTGGDGQLWVTGGTSWGSLEASTTLTALSGTIYYRSAGTSSWVSTGITGARNIDGAYANQCVYTTTGGNVVFYNESTNTKTTIYTGTDAWDVTANGGKIAISTTAGVIKLYSSTYSAGASPSGTTWTTVTTPGTGTYPQLDMNLAGSKIAYMKTATNTPYTVTAATGSTPAGIGTVGDTYASPFDIAYDDSGYVYVTVTNNSSQLTSVYSTTTAGGSTWSYESRSGDVTGITGGAGRSVFGVQTQLSYTTFADETIFGRFYDATTATIYYIDDDRVKSSSSLYGNGVMIAVPTSGSPYTVTESLPSGFDLGRLNVYDPQGNSSGSVGNGTITFAVASNEMVFGEFVNEKLNAKAIALTCSFQYLQTFDASNSSPLYGTTTFGPNTNTYGTDVEGTSYHYWAQQYAHDGYYFLIQNESNNQWFTNDGITDHTGNNGFFMLINASFQVDEFYRQRVTNLVPGLSYTISFYAANASSADVTLEPNITYGLQDTLGNLVNSATSGNITSSAWTEYTFTFTATTGTADLYMSNNQIGGNGNDIAIDDIAINPVITPLPSITVSPLIKPNVCEGTTYTFKNTQSGGVWTSSPAAVATINADNGKAKGLTAGDAVITYTYTNAIGCVSTTTTGIIVSAPPTVTTSDLLGGTSCLDQMDSLYSTPAGGITPYTYSWVASPSTGGGLGTATIQNTTALPTVSGSYTYTLTVTDNVGCSATGSVPLVVGPNTAPTVSASASAAPYCTNSAITLTSTESGGSGTYTYSWSASPTGNGLGATTTKNTTATPTAAGSYAYKIVVNDGFCNVPAFVDATVNASPSVTVSGPTGTQTLCSNSSYTITSSPSGGSGSYTYAWTASRVSGADNPGNPGLQSPTNTQDVTAKPTLTLAITSGLADTYNYAVTVTDGNGCTASGNVNVTSYVNDLANAPTVSITSPTSATTLCSGSTVSLTATATAGLLTTISGYSWTGPGSYTSTILSPGTITPTATGTYTLTVTEANGCKASATTPTVKVNPAPSVTASSFGADLCNSGVDTVYAASSGGTTPYTFLWSVSPTTGSIAIAASTNDTSAISGGTTGTAYAFKITLTDANSCTATSTTTITRLNSTGPTVSGMASAATICINTSKAFSATVHAGSSSILTYAWTGAPTGDGIVATNAASTTAKPTAAGSYIYTLKVTDGNHCAASANTGIQTVNSAITVNTIAGAPGFCGTSGNVGLVALASGGSGAYSNYAWAGSLVSGAGTTTLSQTSSAGDTTTAFISGATVGSSTFKYTAVVTDGNGCTGSGTSSVLDVGTTPSLSTPTLSIPTDCVGQTFTLNSTSFSGGTSPYNYTWTAPTSVTVTTSSGSVTTTPVPSTTALASVAGNYTFGLLLVDFNNCTVSASTAITAINASPVATLVSSDYNLCATPAETINLTGSLTTATTSPYTYSWSGSGVVNNTSSITTTAVPTTSGTYSVIVKDANGCTGTDTSSTVTVNSSPVITLSSNKSIACATPATTLNLTGALTTGTVTPYTYSWTGSGVNNTNTTTTTATPTAAGTYSLKITDNNGCTDSVYTATIAYDQATPSIASTCGNTRGVEWVNFNENSGIAKSWLWTTTSGGRFYTSSALSVNSDSSTSHLQAPFVTFQGTYTVAITDANSCNGSGSYTITSGTCSVILAVTGLDFTAEKQGNEALLAWNTVSETNNAYFNVERSSDGISWQLIGTVKGQVNSSTITNYNFTDVLPLDGINYYRLKQVNTDGTASYSDVRSVLFTGQWLVKLYPNPAQNFVVLEFNNDKDEKAAIVIQTVLGSTIFATQQQLVKGLNRITLNQIQMLAQGTYIITMGTTENIFRSKFIKGGN